MELTWGQRPPPTADGPSPATSSRNTTVRAIGRCPTYDAHRVDVPIANSGASTTSHTVTPLINGTTYYFRVRAVNVNIAVEGGTRSIEADATPSTTPPIPILDAVPSAGNAAGRALVDISRLDERPQPHHRFPVQATGRVELYRELGGYPQQWRAQPWRVHQVLYRRRTSPTGRPTPSRCERRTSMGPGHGSVARPMRCTQHPKRICPACPGG